MRFPMIQAIYQKEMLDMFRDRRTMISMVAVPLVVFPLIMVFMTRVVSRMEQNAEAEAKTMGIAFHVTTPAVREALAKTGILIVKKDNLRAAVEKKEIAAAVEEVPGSPAEMRIYVDGSNPTSSAAADRIRLALNEAKDQKVREGLRNSGIPASVLTPFTIKRTNVADERRDGRRDVGNDLRIHAVADDVHGRHVRRD